MLLCEFILNTQSAPPNRQMLYHTLLELYLAEALPDEPGDSQNPEELQAYATELLPQVLTFT